MRLRFPAIAAALVLAPGLAAGAPAHHPAGSKDCEAQAVLVIILPDGKPADWRQSPAPSRTVIMANEPSTNKLTIVSGQSRKAKRSDDQGSLRLRIEPVVSPVS